MKKAEILSPGTRVWSDEFQNYGTVQENTDGSDGETFDLMTDLFGIDSITVLYDGDDSPINENIDLVQVV